MNKLVFNLQYAARMGRAKIESGFDRFFKKHGLLENDNCR